MSFLRTLDAMTQQLSAFYDLSSAVDPRDFVISGDVAAYFGVAGSRQAQVLVHIEDAHEADDSGEAEPTCNLALYFPEHICNQLDSRDPIAELSRTNLNSLWVVVEELSHFLLLVQRSQKQQQTTALELEWQGEIDKVLMAAMLLSQQNGKSQTLDIAALLHHHCRLTSSDPVYQHAQYYAQKFWYRHPLDNHQSPAADRQLVTQLRSLYGVNWQEKRAAIA